MVKFRTPLKFAGLCRLLIVLAMMVFAQRVDASMFARGDEGVMWLIVESSRDETFTLMHRRAGWPADELQAHGRFNGGVQRNGMAASGDALTLVQQDHSVLRLRLVNDLHTGREVVISEVLPPLPTAVELQSFATAGDRAWALVRVKDSSVLNAIDRPKRLEMFDDEDDPFPILPEDEIEYIPTDPDELLPTYRLLKRAGSRWLRTAMPKDWPTDGRAFLLVRRATDQSPILVVPHDADDRPLEDTIAVYEKVADDGSWQREDYDISVYFDVPPIIVEQQIVFGKKVIGSDNIEMGLYVLNDKKARELGPLSIDWPRDRSEFSLISFDGGATLVARNTDNDAAMWTSRDIRGNVRQEPTQVRAVQPNILKDQAGVLLLIAVVSIATIIFLAFWKREPSANELNLPEDWELCDTSKRLIAAGIDLLPGALVTIFVFDISPFDLVRSWPLDASLKELEAPMLMVVIFVWLTMMFELFTARTPGKMLMGLRVMTLDGEPPSLWAILGRNLLKLFDLIAPPMLLLMFISPHRQRLGDLVARTVVVQQVSNAVNPESDSSDEDDE